MRACRRFPHCASQTVQGFDVNLKGSFDQVMQKLRCLFVCGMCCDRLRWGRGRKEGVASVCSGAGCAWLGARTQELGHRVFAFYSM